MASWDKAVPQGSEAISLGDNRIREMKENLEDAMNVEGVFPVSASAPGFIWTPDRGNTAARPSGTYLVTGRLYLNTQTGAIERYNGSSWDEVNTLPASGGILTAHLGDAQVTAAKIAAAVAGDGLTGGAGTALAVNVDNSTLEISSDAVRIKDLGVTTGKLADAAVTAAKLAAAVAGDGLSGGAGTALSVNVDNSTIEISSDSLRVKDAGVTEAKLATAVVNKLGQNIGLVAVASSSGSVTNVVNYSGQGRLKGVTNSGGLTRSVTVVVDGVTVFSGNLINGAGLAWGPSGLISDGTNNTLNELDIHFRSSLVVSTGDSNASAINVAYERAA